VKQKERPTLLPSITLSKSSRVSFSPLTKGKSWRLALLSSITWSKSPTASLHFVEQSKELETCVVAIITLSKSPRATLLSLVWFLDKINKLES